MYPGGDDDDDDDDDPLLLSFPLSTTQVTLHRPQQSGRHLQQCRKARPKDPKSEQRTSSSSQRNSLSHAVKPSQGRPNRFQSGELGQILSQLLSVVSLIVFPVSLSLPSNIMVVGSTDDDDDDDDDNVDGVMDGESVG